MLKIFLFIFNQYSYLFLFLTTQTTYIFPTFQYILQLNHNVFCNPLSTGILSFIWAICFLTFVFIFLLYRYTSSSWLQGWTNKEKKQTLKQREQDCLSRLCSFSQSYFPVIQLNSVLPLCFLSLHESHNLSLWLHCILPVSIPEGQSIDHKSLSIKYPLCY